MYLSLPVATPRFCLKLSYVHDINCYNATVPQPIPIDITAPNTHVLTVWSAPAGGNANAPSTVHDDVVAFDVEPWPIDSWPSSRIDLVTPQLNQTMDPESVWLKFQITPASSNEQCCIRIDHQTELCELDVHQPHQLFNMVQGTHHVCVWLPNRHHTQQQQCRSFMVASFDHRRREKEEKRTAIVPVPTAWHSTIDDGLYTLIVFACFRPNHLRRLFESLLHAHYANHVVGLRVLVDRPASSLHSSSFEEIVQYVQSTMAQQWTQGPMAYVIRPCHYGLKKNILEAWPGGGNSNSTRLVFLEDDVVVSRWYLMHLIVSARASASMKDMPQYMAGISLYSPTWNEITWTPFAPYASFPSPEAASFMLQLPCSWGAMYYAHVWVGFVEWYNNRYNGRDSGRDNDGDNGRDNYNNRTTTTLPPIPRSMTTTWNVHTSWKVYLLRYMMEHDLHMMYPTNHSYSTTSSPVGTNNNNPGLSKLFQVALSDTPPSIGVRRRTTQTMSFFDVEHRCRWNCRNKTGNTTGNNTCTAAVAAPRLPPQTTLACSGDNDTSQCVLQNVGFAANTFLFYSDHHPLDPPRPVLPFVPSSYRHRCCLQDIPSFQIQTRPLSEQCEANNTIDTTTLMIGGLLQYGHFLHDMVLSLFSTLQSALHRANSSSGSNDTNNMEEQLKQHNVQIIITNEHLDEQELLMHPLYVLMTTLISRHKIWLLNDFKQQRAREKRFCFKHLLYGTAPTTNLYSTSIGTGAAALSTRHLHAFTRQIHVSFGGAELIPPPSLSTTDTTTTATTGPPPPTLHVVTRLQAASRRILNLHQVMETASAIFTDQAVTYGDIQGTFAEQYAAFQNMDVLCAVHGTALLNALFLPREAVVVMVMPYGTRGWMGRNMKRAAGLYEERTVLVLEQKSSQSSLYNVNLVDDKGQALVGEALTKNLMELVQDPDKVWEKNWMHGFALFVNVEGVYVEIEALAVLLREGFRVVSGRYR